MNKFERVVYDLVKSNPKLKKAIRNVYQSIFDLLPKKHGVNVSHIRLNEGFFFGFHDLQPFSVDSSRVLANRLYFDEPRMPNYEDYIDVGYLEFDGSHLGE